MEITSERENLPNRDLITTVNLIREERNYRCLLVFINVVFHDTLKHEPPYNETENHTVSLVSD